MLAEIFLLQLENRIRVTAPAGDTRFVPIAPAGNATLLRPVKSR